MMADLHVVFQSPVNHSHLISLPTALPAAAGRLAAASCCVYQRVEQAFSLSAGFPARVEIV
jgi:hypothetical protein